MRRLAELFKTSYQNPTRRGGMRVAILFLAAFALFTFSTLAHAQVVTTDFENGQMSPWVQNGSPITLEVSNDMAHSGTHSLKIVKSQTAGQGYEGASIDFLPLMNAGDVWEFQVWVRLAPGTPDDKIYLQFRDSTSSVWGGYPPATDPNQVVTDKEWVLLKGRYPAADSAAYPGGASELKVYFNTTNGKTSFYADDFIAYKMQPSGCSNPEDTTGIQAGFETGIDGWMPRPWSGVNLASSADTAHTGSRSLLTSNRNGNWTVSVYDVTGKICNGSQYRISMWVKLATGSADTTFALTGEVSKNGASSYPTFVPSKTVSANAWTEFRANLDMGLDYDKFLLFLQPDTDGASNYYIDDFSVTYLPAGQSVEPIASIGEAYKPFFPVGAAVYGPDVDISNLHSDLLSLHFTSITPENDMKWDATEPAENTFDFSKGDAIVSYAKAHNMAVRGHALVWHQQTPDWVFKNANGVDMSTLPYSDANKALLFDRMKNHIQSLISHFGGDVTSWDVVNEAFDESSQGENGFRKSKWYIIAGGPSYIDAAFQYAKEAVETAGLAGTVKLYLNDYNTTIPGKLNSITTYLSDAKTREIPIDGVGHQFHTKLDWPVTDDPASIDSVNNAINAVAALGFDNQVTELDVSIYRANAVGQTTYNSYADIVTNLQNDLLIQGYRYRDYFSAFKALATAGKLSSVTLWGQADDHTWLTTSAKTDAPLPFDKSLHFKPAYTGIMDAESLPNALPYAASANIETLLNTAKEITLVATDANGDSLTYSIVTGPANGTVGTVTGNKVTYTPAADYVGPETFTFSANDGNGDSNVATIAIDVMAAPVAADQSVTTDLNKAANITLVATGHGTITYAVATQPSHGSLTGTAPNLTYAPATGYWGSDSFTFKANNGLDSNAGTVSITVLPATATATNQAVTVDYSTPTRIKLTSSGSGTITYAIVAFPAKGTLTPVEGDSSTWIYTATTADFKDPYMAKQRPTDDVDQTSFTFKVNNGHDSNVATVSITVNPAVLKVAAASGQDTKATINAGESATFNLLVHGYQDCSTKNAPPVSFTCGGLPNYATCTVNPTIVTLDDQMTPVAFSVTIHTKSSTSAAAASTSTLGSGPRTPWLPACALASFVLIFITMRRTKMQWRMVGASAALLLVMSFTGCGGNKVTDAARSNMVATPAGTYTVTVTAVATRTLSNVQQSDWKVIGDMPLTVTVK